MKMLYILNVAKRVNNFSYSSMIAAQKSGIDFHIAGNWSYESDEERIKDEAKFGIRIHQIDFVRKPYSLKNRKSYKQLLNLCRKEQFDIIHCNTPVGGLLGRLVGAKCKVKTIIYQAHGFHFYKGASFINWFFYYPIEKWLAHKTDILITINHEDYELAKRRMRLKKGGHVVFVPGVGININDYRLANFDRTKIRKELGLSDEDIGIIMLGDLIPRKNNATAIMALSRLSSLNVKLFICGCGPEEEKLKKIAKKLDVYNRVFFLGFRNDIKEILSSMDIFLLTSLQEGLPRSVMEAMAAGLPCVVSSIRGNTDLFNDSFESFLCPPKEADIYALKIASLVENPTFRINCGELNLKRIVDFDLSKVIDCLITCYKSIETDKQKEHRL